MSSDGSPESGVEGGREESKSVSRRVASSQV